MPHPLRFAPALVAVAGLALPAVAHADTTLTFKEVDKGSTFHFIDNPPKAKNHRPGVGDAFVLTTQLADNSGKHIGKLRATCTIVNTSKSGSTGEDVCMGVFTFANGTLDAMVSQSDINAKTTAGGIIGGTGAYAGARGSFVSKSTKTGGNDTVTLLG